MKAIDVRARTGSMRMAASAARPVPPPASAAAGLADPRIRANLGHLPVRTLKWLSLAAAIAWAAAMLVATL